MTQHNTSPSEEKAVSVTLMLIDESGSMASLKKATEESHLGILQHIQQECSTMPNLTQYVNTWTFTERQVIEKQILTKIENGDELQSLELRPNGSTPLFDAIGKACTQLENQLNHLKISSANTMVTVALFTDGFENSSREFSLRETKRLIERLKGQGWSFNYYGSDQSVEEMSEKLSFNHSMKMEYSAEGFQEGMQCYAAKSSSDKMEYLKKWGINFDKN